MLEIVEFIFNLVEMIYNLLQMLAHLIKYWRFWLPTAVAVIATWAFTTQVSNMSACIATGILFMLTGTICGFFLQEKFGPD